MLELLQNVLQTAESWISIDIDLGAVWFNEINVELAQTTVGIVCLTPENKTVPWILFECGVLLKNLSTNNVITQEDYPVQNSLTSFD